MPRSGYDPPRTRGAAARSTLGPSPAKRAAGGSVSPEFIGIIIIIIIFMIILVEFPDVGSYGEPAITEAALGFLFTYLFYSGGALPDFSRQPWPGGRGGEEAVPVGHFSDMLSRSPLFPTLPVPTQSGVSWRGTPMPTAPRPQACLCGRAVGPKSFAEWLLALVPRGIGAMQWHLAGQLAWTSPLQPCSPHGWGLGGHHPCTILSGGGNNPVQVPWAGNEGEKQQEEQKGVRISPSTWRMLCTHMSWLQTSAARPGGPHIGWAGQPRPSLRS